MNNPLSDLVTTQKDVQTQFYNKRFSEIDRALLRLEEPNLSYDKDLMKTLVAESGILEDSIVLEVGAGQGIEGILLSENAELIICTDISREALIVAQKLTKIYNKQNIELVQCDAEFLPFKDNIFNLAFAKDALHHVPFPVKVLLEMKRCSKLFSLIMAIEANPMNPQMALIGLIYYEVDKGVFKNNEYNLVEYFRSANLQNINVKNKEFLPRNLMFYCSSPLLKMTLKYPELVNIFLKINQFEKKFEEINCIKKFSNFLVISGTKDILST